MRANGYIIHETSYAVAIATGFFRPSSNTKTGPMVQVWFLHRGMHPSIAARHGADQVVCGDCPLRPSVAPKGEPRCYVVTSKAPAQIWSTYNQGGYPAMPSTEIFRGQDVRLGAYGEPTLLPLPVLGDICAKAHRHTGYTHQWRNPLFAGYRPYLMASVESVSDQIEATAAGWRTFRVAPKGSTFRLIDEIQCPASRELGHQMTCGRCALCRGASIKAKNIVISAK